MLNRVRSLLLFVLLPAVCLLGIHRALHGDPAREFVLGRWRVDEDDAAALIRAQCPRVAGEPGFEAWLERASRGSTCVVALDPSGAYTIQVDLDLSAPGRLRYDVRGRWALTSASRSGGRLTLTHERLEVREDPFGALQQVWDEQQARGGSIPDAAYDLEVLDRGTVRWTSPDGDLRLHRT